MMLSMVYPVICALFFYSSKFAAFVASLQVSIQELNQCPDPDNGYGCEFRAPGFYRIINYGFQYAATMNDTIPGTAIVSMCGHWPVESERQA